MVSLAPDPQRHMSEEAGGETDIEVYDLTHLTTTTTRKEAVSPFPKWYHEELEPTKLFEKPVLEARSDMLMKVLHYQFPFVIPGRYDPLEGRNRPAGALGIVAGRAILWRVYLMVSFQSVGQEVPTDHAAALLRE